MFTSKMKLADLIAADNNLILMMSRLGIPLGFGDKSVSEVCGPLGLSADFVLLVCNVYAFDDYLPDMKQIAATDMSRLVPYLSASHRYYIDSRLPHIQRHLDSVASRVDPRYQKVLSRFFSDYRDEVEAHFRCEEQEVFPHLSALQQGDPVVKPLLPQFTEMHDSISDKLSDLTQIVYKYLPGDEVQQEAVVELVLDILQLSTDLRKHALIEERVLLPYVAYLEGGSK